MSQSNEKPLRHGCVHANRWWLISIRPEPCYLHEFISPAFLPEQAIYRLQVALTEINRQQPNSRTRMLIKAIDEGKATAEILDLGRCYAVSYFDDSRSYANSPLLDERMQRPAVEKPA